MNPFDAASPFDARYYIADAGFFAKLNPYVSENAQVRYLARVEAALAETLADLGVCSRDIAAEITRAAAAASRATRLAADGVSANSSRRNLTTTSLPSARCSATQSTPMPPRPRGRRRRNFDVSSLPVVCSAPRTALELGTANPPRKQ